MKIVWLLVVLAGCGGSKPPTSNAAPAATTDVAPAPADAASRAPMSIAAVRAEMEQLSDEMCKCKDAACARRVSDELSKWRSETSQASEGTILSQSDTDQLMPIAQRIAACMSNAMTKDSGDPP